MKETNPKYLTKQVCTSAHAQSMQDTDPKYLTNASKESNLGQFMAQSMQDNDQKYLPKHNQCKPLTPKIFDKRIYELNLVSPWPNQCNTMTQNI